MLPASSHAIQRGRTVDPEQVSGKSPEWVARLSTQEIRMQYIRMGENAWRRGWKWCAEGEAQREISSRRQRGTLAESRGAGRAFSPRMSSRSGVERRLPVWRRLRAEIEAVCFVANEFSNPERSWQLIDAIY
jgi:hypothetical protein